MKKYSYYLFPIQLIVLGYFLISVALIGIYLNFNTILVDNYYKNIGYAICFILPGLIFITFRSIITIDSSSYFIFKESRMIGIIMSKEKVRIPKNCQGLILKQNIKRGTGYYKAVIPMNYNVKSCDMFFYSNNGVVRFISTDLKRATIIAELIKENLKIDFKIE